MAEIEKRVSEEQFVVLELAGETYGVDIAKVREIIVLQKITRVPRTPHFVEGIINLRGRVIPIIDLRKRFGLPQGEQTQASRIMVVEVAGITVGMIVDGVSEVLRISSDVIEPPSPIIAGIESEYLVGVAKVGERLIIILDLEKIFNKEEKESLESVS